MCKNKSILGAALLGAVLAGSQIASAETITVQNQAKDTTIGKYQYLVTLDGQAYIQNGDGFVLYDWAGLITSGPMAPSFQELSGPANAFAPFTFSEQLTSNSLTDGGNGDTAAHVADSGASAAATFNHIQFDNSSVDNITVSWGDGLYDAGPNGPATAILTLYTTLTGPAGSGVYGSADRSGTVNGTSYGQADGTIFTPNYAPLPAAWMGGTALFGLVGLVRKARSRRLA